ncbi:hemerythrin domain-containing protein [Lentzea sp. NPDC051213]|uniref:hemerythrin domain-containing protein n=1 Tax=Lentzea sp. NPDC051213 TaxID=3364126 RepID=UPI0037AB0F48
MDTGRQPRTTGETVDTWEMVVIHRWFKREFAQMPALVRGVAPGDRDGARYVAEFIEMMASLLHHHHVGEDEMLWPRLLERVGGLDSELVQRMEQQHEVVGKALERVDELLPRWKQGADEAIRNELAEVLEGMSGPLIEHLGEEESKVLPLVSVYITQAEWDALGRNGASGMPKGAKGFDTIGMILQESTPQERAGFLRLLPPPVRLLHKLIGAGIHQRAKARRRQIAA